MSYNDEKEAKLVLRIDTIRPEIEELRQLGLSDTQIDSVIEISRRIVKRFLKEHEDRIEKLSNTLDSLEIRLEKVEEKLQRLSPLPFVIKDIGKA